MLFDPSGDDDGDEILNSLDNCIYEYNIDQEDSDQDGVGDLCDNCPFDSNSNQSDLNQNGVGDLCNWSGEGAEIILTHSGDRLNNRVSIEVTPPYVERFGSDVCSSRTQSSRCVSETSFTTAQKIEYLPELESSSLISVKIKSRLNLNDKIKLRISCGHEVRLMTLNQSRDFRHSIWDVVQIALPTCAIRSLDEYSEIQCTGQSCSCDQCRNGICSPGSCPEQVLCDGLSGICARDCGGQICNMYESCDQVDLNCVSPLCQSCSIFNRDACPFDYVCHQQFGEPGYCLRACEEQSDCIEGDTCEELNIGFFQRATVCTAPSPPCD